MKMDRQGSTIFGNQGRERRLSNTVKPAGMGLEEWQVALRREQALREHFVIGELVPGFSPGEYQVRNPRSRSQYKVIGVPTVLGTIVPAQTSARRASEHANMWRA